jgi:amidase
MTGSATTTDAYADRRPKILGTTSGALKGLTFAAKDLFDVDGYVTGCGNPDWMRTHGVAKKPHAQLPVS